MNSTQLLQHFELLSEAPDVIKHLRRYILDLAVRGKLVEQDPSDEPAAELLKRIDVEKPGKSQFAKGSDFKVDDLPFDLPIGWACVRFGYTYSLEYGYSLRSDKRSNTGEFPVYGSNGIVGTHSECFVNSPCIIVGRKGSAGALNLSLYDGCCVTDPACAAAADGQQVGRNVAYLCGCQAEITSRFRAEIHHGARSWNQQDRA